LNVERIVLTAPMPLEREQQVGFSGIATESRWAATEFVRLGIGRKHRVAPWLLRVSAWLSCVLQAHNSTRADVQALFAHAEGDAGRAGRTARARGASRASTGST
jgi:hypothetical protein